jgi:hypothetical protein
VATTAEDFLQQLRSLAPPDHEKALRFFHYLIFEFYSFGEFATKPVRMPDGSRMTATTDILYSRIRVPSLPATAGRNPGGQKIGWESPLFDRYRSWEDSREKLQALFEMKSARLNRFPLLALLKILDAPEVTPPSIPSKREHGRKKSFWWRKILLPINQWILDRRVRKKIFGNPRSKT